MSDTENGRLGLYSAEHSKCNHMITLSFKGLSCPKGSVTQRGLRWDVDCSGERSPPRSDKCVACYGCNHITLGNYLAVFCSLRSLHSDLWYSSAPGGFAIRPTLGGLCPGDYVQGDYVLDCRGSFPVPHWDRLPSPTPSARFVPRG